MNHPVGCLADHPGHRFVVALLTRAIFLGVSSIFLLTAFCSAVCPPCYTDEVPLPGHGKAPDGSGRRVMNIYIDPSWNSSPGVTNAQIWNAVNSAASKWNNATDSSGNKTGYYFQVNQSGGSSQADIVIKKDVITGATAVTNLGVTPYVTRVDTNLDGHTGVVSQDSASGTVAHEIGHAIGLGDANANSQCVSANSVMVDANYDETCNVTVPTTQDVAQTNRNLTARSSCQESVNQDTNNQPTDPPPSGGGGGRLWAMRA
jgi:hypothetical protein